MKKNLQKQKGVFIIFFLLIVMFLPAKKIHAQSWSDVGGGFCDWAFASVVYNGELIVGGQMTCAGGVTINNIAKWDGTTWTPLGTGVNGKVWALTVYNGELIAGGEFTQAGSTAVNFLARWDGNSWTDVNGDMGSIISSLTVYNGDLIIGGYFIDADGFPANYVVGYDGNGWFNLGSGMNSQVMALDVYGTDLIAAGFFTTAGGLTANHIAKWDGISWTTLGSGISWITYSLGHYGGDLIAGGLYSTAGGISANSIAKWDGTTWSPLGSGMGATPVGYNYVFALTEFNGSLFAGGMYQTAGGINVNSIAKWDGANWSDLNGGVQYGGGNVYSVQALTVYNNELFASGIFSSAGSANAASIARWNEPLTGIDNSAGISDAKTLEVYPNPFEETTKMNYTVTVPGRIDITVTDITGRQVMQVANEEKQIGKYQWEVSGRELSNGIYFIQVNNSNAGNQSLKLVKN